MDLIFADDSEWPRPHRNGMGALIAVGGFYVPDDNVKTLEDRLEANCIEYGFPENEIFKWSPGGHLWMHDNLRHPERETFLISSIAIAKECNAMAIVIIEDTTCATATKGANADIDVVRLFLERAHQILEKRNRQGLVIISQPSGDRIKENKFLSNCIETRKYGTNYVKPSRIALNVLSSPAKFHRSLQLADIVTSCTTAFVAGEKRFSPSVFEAIKPILDKDLDRIGGVGIKM